MKKYINILLTVVVLGVGSVLTADAQSNRDFRPDFDYYGEEFDWRWDVRVRISDGINNGLITRWEANRLYRKLERIEEKEYAYLADGFFEPWEQDEIWRDVQWLNSRVGLELRDFDRTYYGFNPIGIAFTGYPNWWYNGGYNFYRFDRRGFGSIRIGYAPQCFVPLWVPNRVVYINNYRNYGHNYYRNNNNRNQVVRYDNRGASNRTVTRGSRTNSGRNNGTVYNRNNNNTRRGTAVTSNSRSRSSSVNRSATPNRSSTARARTSSGRSESLNRTNGVDSRSREINRPTTRTNSAASSRSRSVALSSSSRSREISRPSTSSSRSVAPSRSSAGRSESLNRSSRSSSSRSAVNRSSSRPSSSRSSSVSRSSSSGRTKAPEASRSSSSRSRSSSSATRSSRREN